MNAAMSENVPVPEPIAEATLSGNLYYPQMYSGIALFGGAAAVDLLVTKEITVPDIIQMAPTELQMQRTITGMHRSHAAFGIQHRHEGAQSPDIPATAPRITTTAIEGLSMQWQAPFLRTAADFAHALWPDVRTVPNDTPVYIVPQSTPDHRERTIERYEAAYALFKDPHSPAAVALQGLYETVRGAMDPRQNREAQTLALARLGHIKTRMHTERNSKLYNQAGHEMRMMNGQIINRGGQAARDALPQASEVLGAELPQAVADRFATTIFGRPLRER